MVGRHRAISGDLARAGTPATRLEVSATVTFDRVDGKWTVKSSELHVSGAVPGINAADFRKAAEAAKDGCPISRALQGNVAISVEATLQA